MYEMLSLWITGTGVFVGIGVLIVYIFQLKAMRGQLRGMERQGDALDKQTGILEKSVKAADNAAEAAKASAAALINSERAWIVIRPETANFSPSIRFDWMAANTGRTTGRVTEIQLRCRRLVHPEKLSSIPDYREPIPVPAVPVAPQDFHRFWSYVERADRDYSELSGEELSKIRDGIDELVAYGRVKYLDAFDRPQESRFAYRYAPFFREFRVDLQAPTEYHRCT